MFGSLGGAEILLILVLALLLFGPRKLPDVGRMVGRAVGEFRRASLDLKTSLEQEVDAERRDTSARPASIGPGAPRGAVARGAALEGGDPGPENPESADAHAPGPEQAP